MNIQSSIILMTMCYGFSHSNLYKRVKVLSQTTLFTPFHHHLLEQIDKESMEILVSEDKACQKAGEFSWSPKLHQAFLQHHFWTLKISITEKRHRYCHSANTESTYWSSPWGAFYSSKPPMCQKTPSWTSCQAQAQYQEYLESLVKQANQVDDKQWRKLILHLKRAEENCHIFALVKQCMKPQSAGVSCLIIPHPDHPQRVSLHSPQDIKAALVQHCQEHFKKAHSSLFMVPPCPCYWVMML